MNTPTLTKPRIIAIGRCVGGSAFKVTAPPVDWPTFHRKGDNHTYFNATPSSIRRAQRAQLAAALATIERTTWCEVCGLPAEHCRENH